MSNWSVNKPDLKSEDCNDLGAYLRDAYRHQADLSNRLYRLALDLGVSPLRHELLELRGYALYVLGTYDQSIQFVETRGEEGLAEQVGHPERMGQEVGTGIGRYEGMLQEYRDIVAAGKQAAADAIKRRARRR